MNYDYEDDETAYFDSLAGPTNYETHQAAQQQRLTGPIRRTFATTPPGMRRHLSTQTQQRDERERYWVNEQPVLQDLEWSSIKCKVSHIPPDSEKSSIKNICLTQFIGKLRSANGEWMNKNEALTAEF